MVATWNDIGTLINTRWTVKPGVNPQYTRLICDKSAVIGSQPRDLQIGKVTIKELYPIRENALDANKKEVILADKRFFWQYPKIYWTKNMLVARGYIFYPSQFFSNSLRQPVWREKTVQVEDDILTAYTVVDLIRELFKGFFTKEFNSLSFDIDEEDSRPIINFIKFGEPFSNILQQLLTYSQANIQLLNNGNVRIYNQFNITETENYFNNLNKIATGNLINRNVQLQKPKRVIVKVPKVQEVLLESVKSDESTTNKTRVLQNVTRLPVDLKDEVRNKFYYRGMDYPIETIVNIIGFGEFKVGTVSVSPLGEQDITGDTIKSKKSFTFEQFEKAVWIPGQLGMLTLDNYKESVGSAKDFLLRNLIGNLQNDYRRRWKIGNDTLKYLYSYSTTVGVPISADSGTKRPSPVYCDYNGTLRYPYGTYRSSFKLPRAQNFDVNFSVTEYIGRDAPFTFSVENQDTGIMVLQSGQDFEYRLQNFQPFKYRDFPQWQYYYKSEPHRGTNIDPDFKLYTIISAMVFDDLYVNPILGEDNAVDNADFLIINIEGGTSDIDHEVNFSENPAIFTLRYGWENRETIKNQVETLVKPQIESIYQDNLYGNLEEPNISNLDGKLYGTCSSMTYTSDKTITKTVYQMEGIRPPKLNYSNMSSDAQAFTFKSNIFNYKR